MSITIDKNLLESLQDGVAVYENEVCIYVNAEYKRLWIGSGALTMPGAKYKTIGTEVDAMVKNRFIGNRVVQVSIGSGICYYYLYCFPMNDSLYLIISRDITETYMKHEQGKEYEALFNSLWGAARYPIALINYDGVVTKFNPAFFNFFDDKATLNLGLFVWDLFGKNRPIIKELFEETMDKKTSFEYNNFCCLYVSDKWALMYCKEYGRKPEPTENQQVQGENEKKDLLLLFNAVREYWQWIMIVVLLLTTVVGKLDPEIVKQFLDKAPSPVLIQK